MQGSRHGPGGEAELRSFGDDAKIAIGCVVDQSGDSKEAAEVKLFCLPNAQFAHFSIPDFLPDRRPGHCGSGKTPSSPSCPVSVRAEIF